MRVRTTSFSSNTYLDFLVGHELRESGNGISYTQAYRVKKTVIFEADGAEEDAFPLFLALLARIEELSSKQGMPHRVAYKQSNLTHAFGAFAIAPGPHRHAFRHLRRFVALDGTHTRGKYSNDAASSNGAGW